MSAGPPNVLIIDDLFGRRVAGGRNRERENLCAKFLLNDTEGSDSAGRLEIGSPVAMATFYRGQTPLNARPGSIVENDLEGTMSLVREGWGPGGRRAPWALVLLDLCFYTGIVTEESNAEAAGVPEGRPGDDDPSNYFGLKLLDAIHSEFPHLPVLILSSKPREEVSREFSERGAVGFIARDDPRGAEALEEALWRHGLIADGTGALEGNSLSLLIALREARRLAREDRHIIIHGEPGTPKVELANYIARATQSSERRLKRPYVLVGSAALATGPLAEFMGTEERSPGHPDGVPGHIELAKGGDLVLEEVASIPAELQRILLRVLQEQQVQRLGGSRSRTVRLRVIGITAGPPPLSHPSLTPEFAEALRSWNLLRLPPLSERLADLPALSQNALRVAEAGRIDTFRREITPAALTRLSAHSWPGNESELLRVLTSAVSRYPDVEFLVPSHLRLEQEDSAPEPGNALAGGIEAAGCIGLTDFLEAQSYLTFDQARIGEWAGQLERLREGQTRVLARLLLAALEATKRRTPTNPSGLIQIQPALRLAMGDPSLTASRAADLIKRLLAPISGELTGDLAIAYESSIRLRPRGRASKRPGPDSKAGTP